MCVWPVGCACLLMWLCVRQQWRRCARPTSRRSNCPRPRAVRYTVPLATLTSSSPAGLLYYLPSDPLGRCGAVLMFRHQLAVLPALDSDDLGLGLSAPEEDEEAAAAAALGLTSPLTAAAAAPAAAAAAAGAALNSSRAAAAAAPSAAAAVGNSYVDNLGKAGIKEVRFLVLLIPPLM